MSKLNGKVALVTGASKGIGAAIAKELAAQGAAVVVNYASDRAGAEAVVAAITAAGGRAIAVGADVAQAADAQALADSAVSAFGRLDILVNNSGVYEFQALADFKEETYHRLFNVNVLGALLVTKAAAAHMNDGGSIINIGSGVTEMFPAATVIYTATKGALDAITGVLANELGPRRIRVNSVNPGLVVTEGTQSAGFLGTDFAREMIAQTPLGRIGEVTDIATVVAFLASDDAKWLTGDRLLASGGLR